jgi:hypothetical protein
MSRPSKSSTSTVITASVFTLLLVGWVKLAGAPEPSGLEPAGSPAQVAAIEPLDAESDGGAASIEAAMAARAEAQPVQVRGIVKRVLPDERETPRRQRFMIELAGGRMLQIAHDLELGTRVPVELGDEVELAGEYQWNNRGGLVHWTHRDPSGQRAGGWIRCKGSDYR